MNHGGRSSRRAAPVAPLERLRDLGRAALSDCELVALCLGRGGEAEAARLLAGTGGLAGLAELGPGELTRRLGLGPAGAGRVVACLELGLRLARARRPRRPRVVSPGDVHALVGAEMALLEREEFRVVLLGARHDLLGVRTVAEGTRDACLVHSRDVFRAALGEGACSLILVHNHPSGDPTPSDEDRALTRRSVACGRILGVPVLDHVVVGSEGFRSLREEDGEAFEAAPPLLTARAAERYKEASRARAGDASFVGRQERG